MGILGDLLNRKKDSHVNDPITLFTGTLGAGKTVFAIEQADLLQNGKQGVKVYQVNIRNPDLRKLPALPFAVDELLFDAEGRPVLDDDGRQKPRWTTLTDAVIIVDEAHKVFPQGKFGNAVPRYIEAMAETRYESVRWLLVTQDPGELHHFLKGVRIGSHVHIEPKAGSIVTQFFFTRFVARPAEDLLARKNASKKIRRRPKRYFDWYESAKNHTIKRGLPLKVMFGVVVLGWCLYGVRDLAATFSPLAGGDKPFLQTPSAIAAEARASTPAQKVVGTPTGEQQGSAEAASMPARSQMTDLEYLEFFKPIIPSMPWTAKAFRDQGIAAKPDIYCASSGAGIDGEGEFQDESCKCQSDQGTPIVLKVEDCRYIARHGIYNPHRMPVGSSSSFGGAAQAPVGAQATAATPAAAAQRPAVGIGQGEFAGQQARYGGMRDDPPPADPHFGG